MLTDELVDGGDSRARSEFFSSQFGLDQLVNGVKEGLVLNGCLDELCEEDRWGGLVFFDVEAAEDGAEDVEVLL